MAEATYEEYPLWMVVSSLFVQLAIYVLGAYIVLQVGAALLVIYLACVLVLEYRVLRRSCVDCFYYGKSCCFGKGRLCALLFGKGNPEKFPKKEISWTDILPGFLIALVPIAVGIILLVFRFSLLLLAAVAALALLAFPGTGFIRGRWACRYCRQRVAGCPAERLFNRQKGDNPG